MRERDPLTALSRVLGSVDALRNGRALFVLLASFAFAGLLLATAESSLAKDANLWGALQGGAALFVAFYGGNAAGILTMDAARGLRPRTTEAALRASLRSAHRLLLVLAILLIAYALLAGAVLGLLWLCRPSVTGALVSSILFGLVVPVSVLTVGLAALSLVAVVMPLAAPGIWAGAGVLPLVTHLLRLIRQRLLTVALLMAAVSLLAAGMGGIVTFVVMTGGRAISELGVAVVGIEVPPQQLMAGLFGYGLRSVGAAGAPAASGHAAAALIGGGVVFALALVLPGLVYLRGTCAVYLALGDDDTPTDG